MTPTIAEVQAQVDEAGRLIAPLWPLAMGVAMNPLVGLTDTSFDAAVGEFARWLPLETIVAGEKSREHKSTEHLVRTPLIRGWRLPLAGNYEPEQAFDRDIARWCVGVATGTIPLGDGEGLLDVWRRLHGVDRVTRRLMGAQGLAYIAGLPIESETLLVGLIAQCGVPGDDRVSLLRSLLTRLSGWAGHARFQELNSSIAPWYAPIRLADLVTLQLLYRAATGRLDFVLERQLLPVEVEEATAKVGIVASVDHEYERPSLFSLGRVRACLPGPTPRPIAPTGYHWSGPSGRGAVASLYGYSFRPNEAKP
ncbi:putative inorganic carbon transporter subunit DabA [Ferrimicrobium sp.]|uniref:putative inorganic carbon transporter subunit DabA n=1 Tax=Ferrimicrobium sp. TaxID=2926050 RepID=UPI00260F0C36|nr:putative inorganic carbon transporter subunit DabA [Ferrimicrobium sp.]